MRFVVLLFGLLAIPLTALAGVAFIAWGTALNTIAGWGIDVSALSSSPTGQPYENAAVFYLLAAVYGFFGVILSFMRCGWQGALMLILPVILAGIMNPYGLGLAGLQVFTGMLSFLVFAVPIAPAKPAGDDDDKDDDE